jgi:hypothetical protein
MTTPDYRQSMEFEHQYLRREMETNRKYVFERPVLIVVAGITASGTLADVAGFEFLPLAFLALMIFSLWFTYNRLESTSRIIAYLQLVHGRGCESRWIGWEAALHQNRKHTETVPSSGGIPSAAKAEGGNRRKMRFYGPIYVFHVFFGLGVSLILALAAVSEGTTSKTIAVPRVVYWPLTAIAAILFVVAAYHLRPTKLRHSIERERQSWEEVLPNGADKGPSPTP